MTKITRILLILLIGISLLRCKNETDAIVQVENGILIANSTIISANDKGAIEEFIGYILTENEKVVYLGKDQPKVKGNYKIIDGKGKFTIPGLIDSHVHLANMAGMTRSHQKEHPQLVEDYYAQLPKNFLYYGYTSLIDVNNYAPNVLDKILSTSIRPDIYACGEQVQVMNDFTMEMEQYSVEERLNFPFLYDKYNKNLSIPDSIDLELHSPKAIVSSIISDQQGKCVKTLYEDESSGFPQSWELPTLELMQDLIIEPNQEEVPVIMHTPSFNGQRFALEAGVDIIAHAMWNWYDNPENFLDSIFTQRHEDLLLEIAKKKIGYQPTFRAIYGEIDLFDNEFLNNPKLKNIYSLSYLNWLKMDEEHCGKQKILRRATIVKAINPNLYNIISAKFNSDEEMFKGIQKVLKNRMEKVIKILADNNANLLFGTDNGAMNMSTHPPGYNGFLEMQHWLEAGVSLEKIFLAATYNNAKAFHIDNLYGIISKGNLANLLILDKNPLQDILAYDEINTVIIQGKDYERQMLSVD